jgi:hypothetical protein
LCRLVYSNMERELEEADVLRVQYQLYNERVAREKEDKERQRMEDGHLVSQDHVSATPINAADETPKSS